MKNNLFYIFIALAVVNILVNGLLTFINLVIAGILFRVLYQKQKNGNFSTWKITIGIVIAMCSIILGLARMSKLFAL